MTAAEPHETRDWRRYALDLVVLGAMLVSISGQVQTIEGQIGFGFAVVFALMNDVGTVLALDVAITAATNGIRFVAAVAILLSAGSGAALNVFHSTHAPILVPGKPPLMPQLPEGLGTVIGVEPIVLVLALTLLTALVNAARRPRVPATRLVADAVAGREFPTASQSHPARRVAPAPRVPAASSTASLVATIGDPDREVSPARPQQVSAARSGGGRVSVQQSVAAAPSADPSPLTGPRPGWMTPDLIAAVVKSMREAGAPTKRYGEGRLIEEHRLGDGSKITSHKAASILRHIREHQLLEASA